MGYTLVKGKGRACVSCGTKLWGAGQIQCPHCRKLYHRRIT